MTNAVGGNIKVTLTLDDAGFTVKTRQAAENVKGLSSQLTGVKNAADGLETKLGTLGKNVSLTTTNLKSLQTSASSLQKQFAAAGESMTAFNASAEMASQNAGLLNGVVLKLAALLDGVASESDRAAASTTKFAAAQKEVSSAVSGTVNGLTASERAIRNLGAAHTAVAQQVVVAAGLRKNEVAKAAADEINSNNQVLASKQKALDSALKAQREYRASLETEQKKAQALSFRVDDKRDTSTGRIIGANSPLMAQYQAELAASQAKVASYQLGVNILGEEATRLAGNIELLQRENVAAAERISLEERIQAALVRQQQRAQEYITAQATQAQRQKEALEMTKQQLDMVKNMGELYAAMKVEQAGKSAVDAGAEMQNVQFRAKAMGLNSDQLAEFNQKSESDARNNPGLSNIDAANARLAISGGLATKDQSVVDGIADSLLKTVQNMQMLSGDHSSENFQNVARNASGVIEARQQQYDPAAATKTLDLLTKMTAATGGKITLPDQETLLRSIGGGAKDLSDDGWTKLLTYLDQAKVSGGGGGGASLATVGTMAKMFEAYATGKTLSKSAQAQFADAGVLNMDGVDRSADAKTQARQMKNAGLINPDQAMKDPVGYLQDLAKYAVASMTRTPDQQKKYFGDKDVNDPDAISTALTKWAQSLGLTQTAVKALVTAGNPAMQERVAHQSDMVRDAPGNQQLTAERMKTYDQSTANFDAALKNLGTTLGTTVMPLLTDFFNWMTKIVTGLNDFASKNPAVAEFTMIAGAIGGVVLGLKGLTGLLGMTGLFKGFFAPVAEGAASTGILSTALEKVVPLVRTVLAWTFSPLQGFADGLAGLGRGVVQLGSYFTGLLETAGVFSKIGSLFTVFEGIALGALDAIGLGMVAAGVKAVGWGATIELVATTVGKAFTRMIPYVGLLLAAWDFTSLLLSVQVGFASIGDWMDHWMAQFVLKAKKLWQDVKNTFSGNSNVDTEGYGAKLEEEQKYFDQKRDIAKRAQEKKEADQKAADAKEAERQRIIANGPKTPYHGHSPNRDIDALAAADATVQPNPVEIDPNAGAKTPRQPRDQFARSLAEVTSKADVTSMQIASEITGTADDLLQQAKTEFLEKWKAGDFDPDHDANQRPFKDSSGGLDWNGSTSSGSVNDWVTKRAQMLEQQEQLKALQFANQRVASTEDDANAAMARGATDTAKQTREMTALNRELDRAQVRLKNGTEGFAAWNEKKNDALFNRSRADLVNYTSDFAEGDRQTQDSMIYNSKEKIGAQFDTKAQKDLDNYNLLLAQLTVNYNNARASSIAEGGTQEEVTAKLLKDDTEYNDARTKAETAFTSHVQIQANAREYAMRGAVAKQQQEWENAFDKMDEVTAKWGSTFVDNLSTMLTGGTVSWKNFVASMLKDILDMNLKEQLAKPLASLESGLGDGIKNLFSSKVASGTTASGSASTGIGSVLASGASSVTTGISAAAKYFGLDKLGTIADSATGSLKSFMTDGTTQATEGLVKNAAQTALGTSANASATAATTTFTSAVSAATAALAAMAASSTGSSAGGILASLGGLAASAYPGYSGASTATSGVTSGVGTGYGLGQSLTSETFAFADGGIMTSMGKLPLKAYSNGGVASSPQLALFGEGKMNEAYVPLPDGKSIPVSFTGSNSAASDGSSSGAGSIVIQINIDKSGADSSTTSSTGSDNTDSATANQLATQITTIVKQVLLNETRPNGILDKRSKT